MDLDTELDLGEAAERLGTSVEKLIRWGGNGKLAITVMADDWPIRTEDGAVGSISGSVNLIPQDLKLSFNAEFTEVRQVATHDDGEVVTLREPIDVNRGVHFVMAEEFKRFRRLYGGLICYGDEVPAYLDSEHEWRSSQLIVAIQAWTALFSSGDFDPKGKSVKLHIEQWLAKNGDGLSDNAKEYIATLVNPDTAKKGGACGTRCSRVDQHRLQATGHPWGPRHPTPIPRTLVCKKRQGRFADGPPRRVV